MVERLPPQFRELQEITMQTDTRDILAHATRQSESHEDYFLVDIDAHVTETSFWPEILAMIDNDVIRQMGQANAERPGGANISLLNGQPDLADHVVVDHRQRRDPPDGAGQRRAARRREYLAAQWPARHPPPARLGAHSASAGVVGEGREERQPPFHRA